MSSKRKGSISAWKPLPAKCCGLRKGAGFNASILNVKDALLILTSDANLIVAKKSAKGFEQVAKYSVADSATHASSGDGKEYLD